MSDTLYNIFSRLDEGPREKEFTEIRIGRRLQKFLVLRRQLCNHEDGRFGLLITLCKAGRNGLYGQVLFEAFETPQGEMEFLSESPDQGSAITRKHEKDCDACDGLGWKNHTRCKKCLGGGRVGYTQDKPARKVKLLEGV